MESQIICSKYVWIQLFSLLFLANNIFCREAWDRNNFPNPMVNVDDCGQNGEPSWICDPANILTSSEVQTLNNTITAVSKWTCICYHTTEDCGYKMSVAVVPRLLVDGRSLESSSSSEKLEATKVFARYLNKYSWNFGTCNDDLVVVVAVKDRQVWTNLGTNMQDVLSADCVNKIFQDNKELFSKGNYGDGLTNLLEAYRTIITKGEDAYDCSKGLSAGIIVLICVGVASSFIFCGLCFCCATGRCKGGSSRGGRSSGNSGWGHSWGSGGGGGGGGGGDDGGGGSF